MTPLNHLNDPNSPIGVHYVFLCYFFIHIIALRISCNFRFYRPTRRATQKRHIFAWRPLYLLGSLLSRLCDSLCCSGIEGRSGTLLRL